MAETNNREDVRTSTASENGLVLPWGQPPERQTTAAASDVTPGEFVLRHLFKDFTDLAEKKIETILTEPLERPLSKSLQRGEDAQFDQLLNSLNSVAEFSLPSLLKTLFKWYEKQQIKTGELETDGHKGKANISKPKGGSESPKLQSKFYIGKDHLTERRDLAVDFLFCLVLIEVLKQLPVHPVDDGYVQYILSLAFRHFKQRDSYSASPTAANGEIIAALYAEVLGVLAQACFLSVKKRFVAEFKEYQNNPSVFVNIIYGMKYLRIKLYPVEELEESFNFMRDCATLFVDSRDKEVKHAFASMFVEILLPVAAGANRELNVPALKSFVDTMYHHTFDLTKKTRHSQAIYPLVTVLLCVSQKAFFLSSWPSFLSMCLGTLKQRDVKMQKVAMECLYRLVWVYMIRIKGESNTATVSRLRSITDVLFPRGSRGVVPREAPMNYFVKIIQFIAQEKLDFAMNDIVFDLLSVNRTGRAISPERMNIGLRAFFVIADSLQRKGIEAPAMPTSTAPFPSGSTVRVRRVASMKNLTESQASSIGLANYYHGIRKALDSIIRSLDAQIGRPLMMTNPHCSHKEPEDIATGERKPKVDPKVELFRTCIAAIPRCIPEGMTKVDLVDLLSRLTVHMDEELRGLALSSLQSLLLDFADWRETTILGYINFILREIQDNLPSLLDSAMRMLLQLLAHWKIVVSAGPEDSKSTQDAQLELSAHSLPCDKEVDRITVLHNVEGFALVMLCSIHPIIRRLAFLVLKEVRTLSSLMDLTDKEKSDKLVLDVIDQVFPTVLEKVLHSIPQSEKLFTGPIGNVDIMVVNERLSGNMDKETGEQLNISLHSFFWSSLMAGLLNKWYLPELSPSALQFCWPNVFSRLLTVYSLIDSGASGIDSITSLSSVYSRGPKKTMNTSHVCLFRNYLIFACCAYPRSLPLRSDSSEHDGGTSSEGSETRGDSRPPSPNMVDSLFRFAVPLLKSDCSDIREAVIVGLGRTSPSSFRELLEELLFLLREALDRRAEGVRRRRKRDVLRAYLVRIFELNAEHGCFQDSASELVTEDGLCATFIDYIDGTRLYLESESDKDMPAIMQLRLHFANFIYKMITSVPASLRRNLLPDDMRCNLFFLFSSWCAHFGVKGLGLEKTPLISSAQSNDLELASLHAMCGLLQCGPAFDPNGLSTGGYLYNWLQTVLNSPKERIHQLGHDTLVSLLENNASIPSLLYWVIDKCYMGARLVVSGCFKALVSVFTKSEYPCEMIPILNVVLFKTADSSLDIREKAAQLLQLLERRFFPFTTPSLSCVFRCSYSQCQRTLSQALATAHPEITIHMFEEMTARFEMTSSIGQRCILQYVLPWLANVELVDLSNSFPTPPELNIETEEEEEETDAMSPVKLEGEGWGSVEATQLVLNNLFYITVKYDEIFSKEIEEAWGSLCSRWENNIHEILGYLIALAGIIGSSEVLIHAKKLAVYVARARKQKTVEELMEELKLTETVASQFERCEDAPFFRPLQKTSSSRDSVIEVSTGEESRSLAREEMTSQAKVTKEETKTDDELSRRTSRDERKESREERREGKDDKKERGDSLPRTLENDALDSAVPLAEPEEVDQIEEEDKPEGAWVQEWMIMAHRLVNSGLTLSLPVPEGEKFFAPLIDILPFAPSVASLYRCNFALMLLAELVLDQASVDWEEHLPLMLHVIFLALDHGKALVYEHSKRLLVNLIIVLVCRGDHVSLAQSLFNFITVSEQGLGKHGLLKSSWTLDVGNFVGVPGSGAGAGTGAECDRQGGSSVQSNAASAGTSLSESAAGGSSLNIALPPEENSANRLVEQIQELIEFLANSDCKPLWAFEEITPRSYKIKSAEQLELFVASAVQIFQASDSGSKVQEAMAKVALQWATSCSSRHYAGRSFQVFRALKVPLSWSMLSDVLSRLVESVGDSSEDVQGYVMEILLTLETASDWAMTDHPNRSGLEQGLGFHFEDEKEDSIDEYNLHIICASVGSISPLTRMRHGGHIRSLSSGCEFKRHSSLFSQFGRLNGNRDDPNLIRTRSVSVQCLKTPSEAINPQSQADMVTRVFWIAVSLLESDYEHEFLMAIHLLNKVLSILDLSLHDSRDKLDKVLHRLKWNDFPGLQALLLKGLTNAATSEPSLHLLAKLTVFSNVGLVDPSQAAGFALNMLALLPHMLEHFDDPDEFSKTCAQNIVQVCGNSGNLAHLGKLFEMYIGKSYHRPRSTWLDAVYRYINDSYGHLTRSHVTFLLEVLERGPPAYNQVVLGMLCSVMRLADFSSPSMRHFQNDALKTIAKYLKGNFWKESLDILKMAVSHSSHLDTPPPRPASSVWTAYDSSWSTEAMMIKKDLPGRTLDFTFDLSATPVIGRRSTPEPQVDSGKENKLISPVATVDMSVWRKPHLSQRRTRERLVNVLTTCGHTVGLKQSPSVVFSSSSDLAVEKQGAGQQPSSEEASLAEGLTNETAKDELEPQQISVLTNFDFLYDDEAEDVMWGPDYEDRRLSYCSMDTGSLDRDLKSNLQTLECLSGSEQDLTPHDSSDDEDELSRSIVSSTLTAVTDNSTVIEGSSESSSNVTVVVIDSDSKTPEPGTHSRSPSVESSDSLPGASETSYSYKLFAVTEITWDSREEPEKLWTSHVGSIVKDNLGVTAVNTFSMFCCLYKSTRRKFYSLTRECCNYLVEDKFRDVTHHFSNCLEFLESRGDCPFVFIDTETLNRTKLLERHKFAVLELHSHFSSYMQKSERTLECLDDVKLAVKRSSVGSHHEEPETRLSPDPDSQEVRQVQLCRYLYKTHFQFLLFCSTYARLLESLVQAARQAEVNDLTQEVTEIRREVSSVLEHPLTEDTTFVKNYLNTEPLTRDSAVQVLVEKLCSRDLDRSIHLLRAFREKFGGEVFGISDEDNLDSLVSFYCKHVAEKNVGSLVMSGPIQNFAVLCRNLMEVNVAILAAVEDLNI